MPFGFDLKKFKLDEKSGAAKYVNPVIEKIDEMLTKLEKPKAETPTVTTKPEEKKEEEHKQ